MKRNVSRSKAPRRTAKAAVSSGEASGLFANYVLNGSGHAAKPSVIWDPSPNHASRQSTAIDKLVLHNTDGPLAGSLARLKDPAQQVSAHYVVDRNGMIYQLVADTETAWHSGVKTVNQESIGIEIVAWAAALSMTTDQENALISLVKFVLDSYDVPLTNVIPHRAVRATDCPGWVWKDDGALESWKASKFA